MSIFKRAHIFNIIKILYGVWKTTGGYISRPFKITLLKHIMAKRMGQAIPHEANKATVTIGSQHVLLSGTSQVEKTLMLHDYTTTGIFFGKNGQESNMRLTVGFFSDSRFSSAV
ncbi:hypothetical protein ACJX0J_009832, partial [Zea mays]